MNTYNNGNTITKHGNNGKCIYNSNGVASISQPRTRKAGITAGEIITVLLVLVALVTVALIVIL